MIKVKRLPTPEILDGPDSKGGREIARWKEYHDDNTIKKPSKFMAFNDSSVVLTLNKMFNHKCAYCESRVAGIDVEHWRPKNAIIRDDGTRLENGYWWLAADWNHYCPDCLDQS